MAASPAADIYSVAMIISEMLAHRGLPADRQAAQGEISGVLSNQPTKFAQMILRALDPDPDRRPALLSQLVDAVEVAARDRGMKLGLAPSEGQLPIEPAVAPEIEPQADEDDLFNIPGLSGGGGIEFAPGEISEAEEDGRYLVQKDGLDYGPFTRDQVLEQLYADEIHEGTQILDRITQERVRLDEMNTFDEAVSAYLPVREERRRREAEARAELQRKVKQGGVAVFVVGIAAGLVILAGMIYVLITQPDPEPIPLDQAFASLDYKLLPPPKDFQVVAVDKSLMQSIFNPQASEEEIAKQIKKLRRKSRSAKSARRAAGATEESVNEIDMSEGGPATGTCSRTARSTR